MDTILQLVSQINSPAIQDKLIFVKIPFILVGVLFAAMIIFGMFGTSWRHFSFFVDIGEFVSFRPYGFRKIGKKRWREIVRRVETGNETQYKLAVMEANTLLDDALKKLNIRGETLDDRLGNLSPMMVPNLADLQEVQRIRNNIVYDPSYRLSLLEAKKLLERYEIAFRALDLI
ncbi:MAG: hypothetical protein AAB567_01035 [Patescibacteria group bacterium]